MTGQKSLSTLLPYTENYADIIRNLLDPTSVYYNRNKYRSYIGNFPEIITENFEPIQAYYGHVEVRILPPRGLYPCVLPCIYNGKMKYTSCNTCADLEYESKCTHSDEKRMLEGTWCTPEILKAIEKGYIIIKIIKIYNWR